MEPGRRTLDRYWDRLPQGVQRILSARRDSLRVSAGRLQALSPLNTLARGFAVAQDESGALLRELSDFEVGSAFHLRVQDGLVEAQTMNTIPLKDGEQDDE